MGRALHEDSCSFLKIRRNTEKGVSDLTAGGRKDSLQPRRLGKGEVGTKEAAGVGDSAPLPAASLPVLNRDRLTRQPGGRRERSRGTCLS